MVGMNKSVPQSRNLLCIRYGEKEGRVDTYRLRESLTHDLQGPFDRPPQSEIVCESKVGLPDHKALAFLRMRQHIVE